MSEHKLHGWQLSQGPTRAELFVDGKWKETIWADEIERRLAATDALSAEDAREISNTLWNEWNSEDERLLAYADIREGIKS